MKQWRCTVCDHIHKGDAAPDDCPVCGSETSLFTAAGEDGQTTAASAATDAALRWQCVVCGYIHTGPEPPDKCPVCGADRSQFVCLDREAPAEAPSKAKPAAAVSGPDRKWRCKVCGYIHTGPEPPAECPVCGADRSQFEEVVEEPDAAAGPAPSSRAAQPETATSAETRTEENTSTIGALKKLNAFLDRYRPIIDLAIENHAHPISVHIPNGVLPIAVVMVLLAAVFDMPSLGRAAFYNMVFILLSMPVVLFTGYLHWQYKFGGHMTALFRAKIVSAIVVTALALVLVLWALVDPQVAEAPGMIYLGLHLVMLAAAGYAGYLGGRLVFHRGS